jgi:hypothetical protein
MGKNPKPPRRSLFRDTLADLRLALERLEQAGDASSPTLADLKRIVHERITKLEAEMAGPLDPNKKP